MFGSAQQGASAYANIGIETGVVAATPHRLVVMLYEGALVAIAQAITHMKAGNIPAKGQAISKAVMIIESGLRASLDKKLVRKSRKVWIPSTNTWATACCWRICAISPRFWKKSSVC